MNSIYNITEPAKEIPVLAKADVCVVGGSCTGVFAAIRAARLGLSVVLLEQQNRLGGTAVGGMVNIWHSLRDVDGKNQIIAGLTAEVLEQLIKKGGASCGNNPNSAYNFNPSLLAILLDRMIEEEKIHVLLHATYSSLLTDGRKITAVLTETVEGRRAVLADFFIDATGDGRLAKDIGMKQYAYRNFQPGSACFHLLGNTDGVDLGNLVREHGAEFGLPDDWGWSTFVCGCDNLSMRADNHIFDLRCDRAEDLSRAEILGRKQADAFVSLLQKYGRSDTEYALAELCASVGVRETVHYETKFQATMMPLLTGERYQAPILNGTYRVDIHHAEDMGITFRELDGREYTIYGKGTRYETCNWRHKLGLDDNYAKYYQVPFDILVGDACDNLIAAGRMLHADENAFGALRVMVNLNQLGEAAGVAAYHCLNEHIALQQLDGKKVTDTLRAGGSAV